MNEEPLTEASEEIPPPTPEEESPKQGATPTQWVLALVLSFFLAGAGMIILKRRTLWLGVQFAGLVVFYGLLFLATLLPFASGWFGDAKVLTAAVELVWLAGTGYALWTHTEEKRESFGKGLLLRLGILLLGVVLAYTGVGYFMSDSVLRLWKTPEAVGENIPEGSRVLVSIWNRGIGSFEDGDIVVWRDGEDEKVDVYSEASPIPDEMIIGRVICVVYE
jgi:hypothetical protein